MRTLCLLCLLSVLQSHTSNGLVKNPLIRYNRQNTIPDLGIPNDWIEDSPIDQNGANWDFPLPDGIPNETEGESDDKPPKIPKNSNSKKKTKTSGQVNARSNEGPPSHINDEEMGEQSTDNSMIAPTLESINVNRDVSKLVEICDKPVIINAANRYTNSTVRLFRDRSYWDLMSLPDRKAFTSEKMALPPPMSPVPSHTSIVTILEGSAKLKGKTYKFEKQFFWTWDEEGKQERGGRGGEFWEELPKGGFDTMFHNANQSKPMIIAFKGNLVYYLSTKEEELEFINPDGVKGGKFKENFPPALTAAFTWPLEDKPKVYLFRDDKYCMRDVGALPSGKDCEQWLETAELFGCVQTEPPTTPPPKTTLASTEPRPPPTTSKPPNPQPVEEEKTTIPTTTQTTPRSGSPVLATGLASLMSLFVSFVFNRFNV